jgi:hypothetical protein
MLPSFRIYLQQYFTAIEKVVHAGPQKRPFFANREYYFDSRIDNFLNFCLKYNIEIPAELKTDVIKMGSYYQWLFDLDNFDYSSFNTDWLYAHFTLFFKRRFRQSLVLKEHLLNIIKNNPDNKIERIFIDL